MSSYVCFLITVLNGTDLNSAGLLRCALKVHRGLLPDDADQYPMVPETREALHALLPLHVQRCGPIVEVQPIFEVAEVTIVEKRARG